MQALLRELRLLLRQPGTLALLGFVLLTATTSLGLGAREMAAQQALLARLIADDRAERAAALERADDWGDAAYHAFVLTYAPPPTLAFVALGQRDVAPWLLRVRALALEGQIYESDRGNPELALLGRLDYAFVIAFLVPLFVAALLHDLVARERDHGRLGLLLATAAAARRLWVPRVAAALLTLLLCLLAPFVAAAALLEVPPGAAAAVMLIVIAQTAGWAALVLWFAFRPWDAARIASVMAVIWLLLNLLLPLFAKLAIERTVTSVSGAEIALRQREAVNDAWGVPKEVTMTRFFRQHPEWAATTPVQTPFHWKWYYAFQHLGDVAVADLSAAYRAAIRRRDELSAWTALISPAVAVQRALTRLAGTDVEASLHYDARIRAFHTRLRQFWYPLLFDDVPFARERLREVPAFAASATPPATTPGSR